MKRRQAERGGRRAETLAASWLRLKGWRILAARGRTLAFIEVTARGPTILHGSRSTIIASAAPPRRSASYARATDTIRIDAIFMVRGLWPHHIENVWRG